MSCVTSLPSGCEVTAFVRDPSRLPQELSSQVTVKAGDVLDAETVAEAVKGQEAVVILLGTRNNLSKSLKDVENHIIF